MKVYTAQIKNYNKDIIVDITVKSGNKAFAPTWELVSKWKKQEITMEEYTIEYYQLMRKSYKENNKEWLDLLKKDSVTLGCYCMKDSFCHRYLLIQILRKIADKHHIPFHYMGEM